MEHRITSRNFATSFGRWRRSPHRIEIRNRKSAACRLEVKHRRMYDDKRFLFSNESGFRTVRLSQLFESERKMERHSRDRTSALFPPRPSISHRNSNQLSDEHQSRKRSVSDISIRFRFFSIRFVQTFSSANQFENSFGERRRYTREMPKSHSSVGNARLSPWFRRWGYSSLSSDDRVFNAEIFSERTSVERTSSL